MKSRTKYISLAIIIVLAFSLAACERSASPAPQEPLPTAEISGMELVEQMLTTPGPEGEGNAIVEETSAVEGTQPETLPPPEGEQPTEETPPVASQPLVETVRPEAYTLQKGEFPYCIARRYNIDPKDLMSLNGLSVAQSRSLQPGLVLRIPQTSAPFPGTRALQPHPTGYTVQSGTETIYSIACKFGSVDPVNIANQNGLIPPYTLSPGQYLEIP